MKKEKHYINKVYGNHQLSRYIDVYEVSANRCHSVPESGYKGTEATLVDDPAWNEKFSSYSITGATLTGNNFILNNDVTAQANYETAKNLTLLTEGHGTIAANKMSGFIGDQVTLSNTAATNYSFSGYTITGATLTGNKFNFTGSNVTAKAWYIGYTASALDTPSLRECTAFTGKWDYRNLYFEDCAPLGAAAAKSYNGTSVNLTFNLSLFPFQEFNGYIDSPAFTTYEPRCDVFTTNGSWITAGRLKLNNGESAVITSLNLEVTGLYSINTRFPTLKWIINGNTYDSRTGHINETATFQTKSNMQLAAPIILTNNTPSLTVKLTGTTQSNTCSEIRATDRCLWNGYISGRV